MAKKIYEACRRLLTTCANCQPNENILIVTDTDSLEIGMALWDAAEEFPKKTMVMMEPRKMHGEEPTPLVAAAMLKADVIFRATKFSLSHSHARRDACAAGARDLNCCDYSIEMLEHGGLYTDFEADRKYVDQLLKSMADGDPGPHHLRGRHRLLRQHQGPQTLPAVRHGPQPRRDLLSPGH